MKIALEWGQIKGIKIYKKVYSGGADVFKTSDLQFKSSHWQLLIFCQLYWNDKNEAKRGFDWPN